MFLKSTQPNKKNFFDHLSQINPYCDNEGSSFFIVWFFKIKMVPPTKRALDLNFMQSMSSEELNVYHESTQVADLNWFQNKPAIICQIFTHLQTTGECNRDGQRLNSLHWKYDTSFQSCFKNLLSHHLLLEIDHSHL